MPWLGKVYDILNRLNVTETLRPAFKQFTRYFFKEMLHNLEDIDGMTSPRVIKSHLPFYLLNPQLLNTCKVIHG